MISASRRPATWDRIVDLGCIAGAFVVALDLAGEAETSGRLSGDAQFWPLVLAGAASLALWWRRRHPVTVALCLAPMLLVTDQVIAAVVVALYSVAANRRWRTAVAVALLNLLFAVPYSIARADVNAAGSVMGNLAVLSITVALGMIMRSRREEVASLTTTADQAEVDATLQADKIRALERENIAREMHDVLAHRISQVSLHAGALEIRSDLSTEEVARAAAMIRTGAHQALEDLREILGVLRAGADVGTLRPQPGLADLDHLIDGHRSANAAITVDDQLSNLSVATSVSRTAYRIVEEGLINARKHAQGAKVSVTLNSTAAGEIHVWLHNPLVFDQSMPTPGSRSGLVGLAERVSLVGGRLDYGIRHEPVGGVAFHLEAWIPAS